MARAHTAFTLTIHRPILPICQQRLITSHPRLSSKNASFEALTCAAAVVDGQPGPACLVQRGGIQSSSCCCLMFFTTLSSTIHDMD